MRKIFIPILIAFLMSAVCACRSKTLAKFEITNATDETIDSIKIMPDNIKNHYIQLAPNSKAEYIIDMTGGAKVDGSYGLFYKFKNKQIIKHFGYYSNGNPAESLSKLTINEDSLNIRPEYNNNY